jgi:CubicO group peptidase (beta-lactamase class C family)
MRKLFTLSMLIGVLFPLVFTSMPVLAQDTTLYEDPAGRFSVPVPVAWTDESTNDVGRFVTVNGLATSIFAVEEDDAEAGATAVLAQLAPDLVDAQPVQMDTIPSPSGTWAQRLYALDSGRLVALLTQWVDGVTYAMLFDASTQDAFTTNQGEIIGLILGFSVGERIDLAGVMPHALTDAMLEDLETYIETARERYHVPAVAIAVVQNGDIVYTNGFGTTEPDGGQAVTVDTLFMIGSITKSMTTMMMGTLVDDGLLDWNQPVTDLLPSFALSDPAATPQIRVRDLVNMSSGVSEYNLMMFLADFTPQEMFTLLAEIPMVAAPGETYNYSNQMVTAGGYVSALATGVPMDGLYEGYVDLIQERVFDPIEMPNTTFDFEAAIASPNHALPFVYKPVSQSYSAVPLEGERFVKAVAPAGAVWSNVEDMARYLVTVSNAGAAPNGTQVVSAENLQIAQSPEVAIAGSAISYGMGWVLESYHGQPLVWHNGGTLGFSSDLAFLSDADVGVVILTDAAGAVAFNNSVREYVFELAFGLDHRSIEQEVPAQVPLDNPEASASIDPQVVAPFLRTYEHGVTVEMQGDDLWLGGAFAHTPLIPAGNTPGTEAGDYTGVGVFNLFRVRFVQSGDQVTLDIMNLATGESLSIKSV